jgi:hypothetical protein
MHILKMVVLVLQYNTEVEKAPNWRKILLVVHLLQ